MNRIDFGLRFVKAPLDEPDAGNYFAIDIRIDDRDLLSIVREVELPFATAEGHSELAGGYTALPSGMVLSDLAIKQTEKISLYDCECGCFGCWPLRVRISMSENIVIWSEFEQPHRGPNSRAGWWHYDKLGPFEFDREQYLAALTDANCEVRSRQSSRSQPPMSNMRRRS